MSFHSIQQDVFGTIVDGLSDIGIIRGQRDELIENQVFKAFMPHSLGHYLGLYVHDVGPVEKKTGEGQPPIASSAITSKDRLLKTGMVLTVEPGIYFIDSLLSSEKYLKYINLEMVNRFRQIGGIRIEDNVQITKYGHKNMTTAAKSIQEIEQKIKSLRQEVID